MITSKTVYNSVTGERFIETFSDEGYFIIRNDGKMFETAIDSPNTEYTYTQSTVKITE